MIDNNTSEMHIWRCSGGNCLRNGLFPERVKIKPKPVFTLTAEAAIQASVVFDSKGNCYVADMSGLVQSFDSANKLIWKVNLNGSIIATPVVLPNDNYLFVATTAGSVYAIDCGNGKILHKKEIPTKTDPRILSNLLYVEKINSIVLNSWGGKFCCLTADKLDEKFVWDAGIFPYSGASSDSDGNIYSLRAVANRGIECVKVKPDGTETIIYCESERKRGINRMLVSASPVINDKRKLVYVVINRDAGANLCAISTESDKVLFKMGLPNSVQATPVIRNDGAI
ncbi:MAG TPA: PQQ-binding-like beta-propeller repeat protein, partial [Verrucomicrobiota bacterium]|nr:PQQ-binding-like beta-propeller repeat protein [Verrucomicrobiota bacterium]